jgi:hypothetical protein
MPRPKLQVPNEKEDVKPISFFIIGCGGKTEAIYFNNLVYGREDIRVETLPPDNQNLSSPLQTIERINKYWEDYQQEEGDQIWVVLDVDHHFTGGHENGTKDALELANSQNYSVVFSNPCFELWLLLHHEEVLPVQSFPDCKLLVDHLRTKRGRYRKTTIDIEEYLPNIPDAINRARRLRNNSSSVPPRNPGTDIDKLMNALNDACGEFKVF